MGLHGDHIGMVNCKGLSKGVTWGLRFRAEGLGGNIYRDMMKVCMNISPRMENQIDKNMEHETETGVYGALEA